MRITKTSRLAGILAGACLASVVLATAPAQADSVQGTSYTATSTGTLGNNAAPGGTVTRSQVLARAQAWVDQHVPYSTNGLQAPYSWWSDSQTGGRYRQDCSGLVSMAWELTSSPTTYGIPSYSTAISKLDLRPGDVLNSSEHVVIFAGWRDKAAGTFNYYQESSRSRPTNYNTDGNIYGSTLSTHAMSSYTAYRYKNITDDVAPNPTPSSPSTVHVSVADADGALRSTDGDYAGPGWSGSWAPLGGSGLKALTSAVTGNTMHVYALGSTGRVYTMDADYNTGQWSGTWQEIPGNISGATALTAAATGNRVHLSIVDADGGLRSTDGEYGGAGWSGSWAPLGGSGLKALTSAVTGNTMHVYALGSTGRVYTMDADYNTGQWSGTWQEIPGNISGATALTAAATGNRVHLSIVDADGGLRSTDGDYAGPGWSGSWAPLGGSGLTALASTVTGNTMHVYALGSTGRVFTMDADYNTGQWSTAWQDVPGDISGARAITASTTR
ncbi:hypothetical protein ACGF0D_18310 [Kitasatospora sp. NPDC048298]|uniref:hypothetical protein n=1 Tax=Kitasatospora sp. NPDC048298 TaxID=3364049 RepID=UPI00371C4A36